MKKEKVKKPFYKRWWFILLVVLIVAFIAMPTDDEPTSTDEPEQATQEPEQEASEAPPEEEKGPDLASMSTDEYLAYMVNEVLGEETNNDVARLVSVTDGDEGIKDVTLRADDNFTTNMIVGGMLMNAEDYYKAIYQDPRIQELKAVSLIFEMTLVDKLGNEADYPVHIITISNETLNKINWDNFLRDNIPDIADTYFLHNALKE